MNELIKFIEDKLNEYQNLSCSEVIHFKLNELKPTIVEYLKSVERFDYKGICVYYVEEDNNIWLENMNAL